MIHIMYSYITIIKIDNKVNQSTYCSMGANRGEGF